jgi:PAS domain S-box-containing protein
VVGAHRAARPDCPGGAAGSTAELVLVRSGRGTERSAALEALLATLTPAARRDVEAALTAGSRELAVGDRTFAVVRVAHRGDLVVVLHETTAEARRLRAAEQRFESFMEHCPVPAVIKDADGRYVWANDAYFTAYHVDRDGWVGKRLHDYVPAEQAAAAERLDQRVLATGAPLRDTHRFVRQDGTTGVDAGVRFPLPVADGAPLLGGIFIDLTEDRRTRDRLARWRDRYRTLFDRAPVGMVVTTAQGVVLDANPAFCQMVGRTLSTLRGTNLDAVRSPASAEPAVLGAPAARSTTAFVRPDGTRVGTELAVIRVPDPDDEGSLVGIATPLGPPRRGCAAVLGPHEVRVLELRAAGAGAARTASELGITRRGVDYHVGRLARRLGCHPTELVARAYHLGVLDAGAWPPRVQDGHRG